MRKHCWVSVEPPYVSVEWSAEGLPRNVRRRLHSSLRKIYAIPCGLWVIKLPEDDFAGSRRRFYGLHNLRSPKDCLHDSHKTNPQAPERQFCRFLKMILWIPKGDSVDPERWFRRLATDDPQISAQTFTENCDELLWKSTDFRKLLVTCTICEISATHSIWTFQHNRCTTTPVSFTRVCYCLPMSIGSFCEKEGEVTYITTALSWYMLWSSLWTCHAATMTTKCYSEAKTSNSAAGTAS